MAIGTTEVAIVGAGPYGLSLAAHLEDKGVTFRILGRPMQTWWNMPRGMFLKSLGFATNVYTADGRLDFVGYCQQRGLESNEPCAIVDFARYGIWAQKQLVPELEETDVTHVARTADGFELTSSNGSVLRCRQVVIAVGITHFARMPDQLAELPPRFASHTSQHTDYRPFADKDVIVVGGGQSAFEAARLLLQAGARPQLLVRAPQIGFSSKMPPQRGWWERVRRPQSGLGPGLKNWVLENLPLLVHFMPDRWRLPFVKSHLGPNGAWWLRDRIVGKVPVLTNCVILDARLRAGRLSLDVSESGSRRRILCDHVIAGTGYEVDIDRLAFLDADLRGSIRRIERGPALDFRFQSSVPGLYFIGPASSLSFGPLFRFVAGAAYSSRSLSRELARRRERTDAVALPVARILTRAAQ
jgi:hypothetical protein